ncbi:MAG TPA: endonuclease III [Clostridiaceae bacterium]|nr:endonuclease III [Clostridiaceae bacterium]
MSGKRTKEQERARIVVSLLLKRYPQAECTLTHASPWELLVGGILASQCTDERVNKVTPVLFERYPDLQSLASANRGDVEDIVRSCGLYKMKAKALVNTSAMILERFGGQVPQTRKELMELPGVGRKIANLILGEAFGFQEIVVDTHCGRISRLLGFTDSDNPVKVEKDLLEVVPEDSRTLWGHLMVAHGRDLCKARCRICFSCPVRLHCQYGSALQPSSTIEEGDCV